MAPQLMDDNGLPDRTFAFLESEWRVCDWRFEDRVTCVGRAHAVDGNWRMAGHVAVQQALRNHLFDSLGLPRLYLSVDA